MATATKPSSLKQQVHDLIDQLPENCTIDDIHYQLLLIDKISRGEDSLREKCGISHTAIKMRVAKWTTK